MRSRSTGPRSHAPSDSHGCARIGRVRRSSWTSRSSSGRSTGSCAIHGCFPCFPIAHRAMSSGAEAVSITHPEKVLFPADGITKGEMAEYYRRVGPIMVPHIARRPITMERFHRGIGEEGFYQKSVTKGFPAWLERAAVPKKGGTVQHPLVTDVSGLLWLANMNCITPHVWTARAPDLMHPDLLVFDLDPSEDDEDALRAATLLVRDALTELGLLSRAKTTGAKGFHVVVALDGSADYGECAGFAHAFGRELARRHSETFTQEF